MTSNINEMPVERVSADQDTSSGDADGENLTATETLELVRTFSQIKDPGRRRTALDYLKNISTETVAG